MRYVFPIIVAVAELGAGLVYLYLHEWRLAIVWLGYSLAAFALAAVK